MQTNADIIPGKSIDGFELGWNLDTLIGKLRENYTIIKEPKVWVISYQSYKFWYLTSIGLITQIGIFKGYERKVMNIEIGKSTLQEVEKYIGKWQDSIDGYIIPNIHGLCFELDTENYTDDCKEDQIPIAAIYVFPAIHHNYLINPPLLNTATGETNNIVPPDYKNYFHNVIQTL